MPKLTERQRAFCRELVKGATGAEAARLAGYRNAGRQAYQLLEKPHITAYLNKLRAKVEDQTIMSAREVLQRLTGIARGEGRVERSTPVGIVALPPDWSDQQRALTDLAKHHSLLVERAEIGVTERGSDAKRELSDRLARQLAAANTQHSREPN